jgi:hypothetical protein
MISITQLTALPNAHHIYIRERILLLAIKIVQIKLTKLMKVRCMSKIAKLLGLLLTTPTIAVVKDALPVCNLLNKIALAVIHLSSSK